MPSLKDAKESERLMDKLTTKSQEALAEAIRLATDAGNPQVEPLHLLAALLAKVQSGEADAINAHQALHMATLAGARALGLDDRIGSLVPGKEADLCAIDSEKIGLSPCYDPASHVVYAAGRADVSDVWVAGKQRVKDGRLREKDEFELISLARLWQNQVCPRDA